MRFDLPTVQRQISQLILQYPELGEDEVLRADMLEGETDAFSFLSHCVRWIGEDTALCEGTSGYIKTLQERRTRIERRIDAFRSLAFSVMQAAELQKAELPEATLSVRNGSPKVVIIDEAELPDCAIEIKRIPDKTKIKELLKAGETVIGAALSNAEPTLAVRFK
jgi:hypothetical protein